MEAEMVTIRKSLEMFADVDWIWEIISETDDDQKYWTALRDIKVLSRDGNKIEREANVGPIAFSHKSLQTVSLAPKKSIKLKMIGDPMTGERMLVLVPLGKNSTRVDVAWDFELNDVPGFVQGIVKGQISKATDEALERIKEEAERTTLAAGARASREQP